MSFYNLGANAENKLLIANVKDDDDVERVEKDDEFRVDFSLFDSDFAPNVKEFVPFDNMSGKLSVSYDDLECEAMYSVR